MCRHFDGLVDHYRGACAGAGDPLGKLKRVALREALNATPT